MEGAIKGLLTGARKLQSERISCKGQPTSKTRQRSALLYAQLGLYKIFVHVEAVVHESNIIFGRLPPALPALLQYYCTTMAQYTPPPTPLVYAIHHTRLVMAISCKGQCATRVAPSSRWLRDTSKRKLADVSILFAPPSSCCPVFTRG